MSKERELLEQVQQFLQCECIDTYNFAYDIEQLLAQPEQDLRKGLREELSLRDHFAGLAMQGLMNVYAQDYSKSVSDKEIADWSYDQANAMLKARGGSDE